VALRLDPGETPDKAAAREAREEANIQVSGMRLLKKVRLKGMGDVFFFHSTKFSGKPRFNWESDAMKWVPKGEVLSYPLVPGIKTALAGLAESAVAEPFALMERGKDKVAIFDFDGTLFKSPNPPRWWKKKKWWRTPESLDPPCVPEKPDASWWNGPLVSLAKKRIGDPSTHTVLLTGRWSHLFGRRVRELLKQVGLNFDEVLLSDDASTLAFKTRVLSALAKRFEPKKVEIWDDHPRYTRNFQSLFDKRGIRFSIKNTRTLTRPPACPTPEGDKHEASKKRVSIDAVVTFKHQGKTVTARVKRTQWSPKGTTYYWTTDRGKEITTQGVPKDARVVADVKGRKT